MNDPRNLTFFFDFSDPASFILDHRLRALEGDGTFFLIHEPFERIPPPTPRPLPQDPQWQGDWAVWAERAAALGLAMTRPSVVPWTRKAHELAMEARGKGCFRDVLDTLFRAYFMHGRDIGRVDVLVELGRTVGLDAMETKAALDVDVHRQAVEERRREGEETGIARPPALVWDGKLLEGYPEDPELIRFLDLDI